MLLPAIAFACTMTVRMESPAIPRSILVYSKTAGFRHDSIADGRRAILDIGIARNWTVTFSEDPSAMDSAKLKGYDAIVFLSTTGKFLGPKEEKALVSFVHHGGGVAGIHAASDAENKWPWYGKMMGATFVHHPAQQDATVNIEDTTHPSTRFLPNPWRRRDEWYDFDASPRGSVHVLASLDQTSYSGSTMKGDHPIMWCHLFDGGRAWYTEMGHTAESYQDPLFLKMVGEGIEWACDKHSQ